MQAVPRRVLAPHLGAFEKSPGGLLFFNHPRRFSWGSLAIFASPPPARAPANTTRDDSLTAGAYVDLLILDHHALRPTGLELHQRQKPRLIDVHHPRRCVRETCDFSVVTISNTCRCKTEYM